MKLCRIAVALCCAQLVAGCASVGGPNADAHLRSTPETVVWGYLPAGRAPVLTVRSGQTVRIDTVSHQGVNNGIDPRQFFGAGGIAAAKCCPTRSRSTTKARASAEDAGAHVLTGPIFSRRRASPATCSKCACVDLEFRVPYGVNNSNKGTGVLPDIHSSLIPRSSASTCSAASRCSRRASKFRSCLSWASWPSCRRRRWPTRGRRASTAATWTSTA